MTFAERLAAAVARNASHLCVGLDPGLNDMPAEALVEWAVQIVEATNDLVCAYKPNSAFYEARGAAGWQALERIIASVPSHIPVILDCKRADLGNTAEAYAHAAFSVLKAGAITVSPYMGYDSIEPFLRYPEKAVFVLCRTSNQDARQFQDLEIRAGSPGHRLFEEVAQNAHDWASNGDVGLVAGATYPEDIQSIRAICPEQWLLVPGIGTQGGDLQKAVQAAQDAKGTRFLINASRSIAFGPSRRNYAAAAREAATVLRDRIESARALSV